MMNSFVHLSSDSYRWRANDQLSPNSFKHHWFSPSSICMYSSRRCLVTFWVYSCQKEHLWLWWAGPVKGFSFGFFWIVSAVQKIQEKMNLFFSFSYGPLTPIEDFLLSFFFITIQVAKVCVCVLKLLTPLFCYIWTLHLFVTGQTS